MIYATLYVFAAGAFLWWLANRPSTCRCGLTYINRAARRRHAKKAHS